jgi:hypothetical protein
MPFLLKTEKENGLNKQKRPWGEPTGTGQEAAQA